MARSVSGLSENPSNLELATSGLVPHMKLLVKSGLEASAHSPEHFLDAVKLNNLTADLDHYNTLMPFLVNCHTDTCAECSAVLDDDCYQDTRTTQIWHVECLKCRHCSRVLPYTHSNSSQQIVSTCRCGVDRLPTIRHVTVLQHYRHLLWAHLARLSIATKMDFDVIHGISLDRKTFPDTYEGATRVE
jgi:hypothetical protein